MAEPGARVLAADPRCNPACGVCHYKDLDYPEQLRRKDAWAAERLAAWADRREAIVPAPDGERLEYRAKSWMRAALVEGRASFGMMRSVRGLDGKWREAFTHWDGCPIHTRAIQEATARLRERLGRVAPEFVADSLFGIWIGTPHLVLVARGELPAPVRALDWADVVVPPLDRVWFHRHSQVGRKIFGHGPIEPLYSREVSPRSRATSPRAGSNAGTDGSAAGGGVHPIRAFRQVAQTLLVQARARAVESLLRDEPDWILDLYCGTGELARLIPRETGWLGLESAQEAVAYAQTFRPNGPVRHEAFVGLVEHRLRDPRVRGKIDGRYALYLNPPRSGLAPEARAEIGALLRERPPTSIAYLSCSVSSLARDLVDLERAGYRVESLRSYDFFPQTEHFETLALLRRR